jgi:Holliday junction resolvasome RuvABC endonuclease subunit
MLVGIDQSLTATGICVLDNNLTHLYSDTVVCKKERGVQRIEKVVDTILAHVQDLCAKRIVVVREGYSYGSKSNSVYDIGELGGCINYTLNEHFQHRDDCVGELYIIPPTSVKKFVLGKGNIKKDSYYLKSVYESVGIDFEDDNQADAYMLAYMMGIIQFVLSGDIPIDELSPHKMESMISPAIRKKFKMTPAKIKKLGDDEFLSLVQESINHQSVRIF